MVLPEIWVKQGQTRLLVYIKEFVSHKVIKLAQNLQDLPLVTVEVWRDSYTRQWISYFYREYTGVVSFLASTTSQGDRLHRAISHWTSLDTARKDLIIMGDLNLDYPKWTSPPPGQKELVD